MNIKIRKQNKQLLLTGHCRAELYDRYRKDLDLVFEILVHGRHTRQSMEKTRVELMTKAGKWEFVYVENETDIIIIHIKLRR